MGAKGLSVVREEPVGELEEEAYPSRETAKPIPGTLRTEE